MKTYTPEIIEQVEQLLNVGIALSAEKDHNILLETILREARRITGADAGTLYLREGDCLLFKITHNDTMKSYLGGRGEPVNLPPVPLQRENVSAFVALTNKSVNIADVYSANSFDFDFSGPKRYDAMTGYRTTSMLVVPLENHEAQVIGVLQLINATDDNGQVVAFAPHYEKVVASLASQAAIALTNMNFIAEIENLFNSFVQVMATAVDAQTPYNANHTRRVALFSGKLARVINQVEEGFWGEQHFNEDRTAELVMAAWLHDIGKIATPLAVMNKATRLEARIELVLQRMDYIRAELRAEYLERKLGAKNKGDQEAADSWWKAAATRVDETKSMLIKVDNPSTFVDGEMAGRLKEVATYTYVTSAGEELPWLTPDELTQLCVTKGTLTDDERKVMENHVEYTTRMLDKIPFISKLRNVPFYAGIHHEHLDGKGYPHGLKGEEIPPEGRILALLDIYDALTADDRPYKKALPVEEALKIIGFMVKDGKLDAELFNIFKNSEIYLSDPES
ncbi:MAG: HD domain-containing phosphohydrolase [Methylocystaceae bacterium]